MFDAVPVLSIASTHGTTAPIKNKIVWSDENDQHGTSYSSGSSYIVILYRDCRNWEATAVIILSPFCRRYVKVLMDRFSKDRTFHKVYVYIYISIPSKGLFFLNRISKLWYRIVDYSPQIKYCRWRNENPWGPPNQGLQLGEIRSDRGQVL